MLVGSVPRLLESDRSVPLSWHLCVCVCVCSVRCFWHIFSTHLCIWHVECQEVADLIGATSKEVSPAIGGNSQTDLLLFLTCCTRPLVHFSCRLCSRPEPPKQITRRSKVRMVSSRQFTRRFVCPNNESWAASCSSCEPDIITHSHWSTIIRDGPMR